jgi:hypothetical protein
MFLFFAKRTPIEVEPHSPSPAVPLEGTPA